MENITYRIRFLILNDENEVLKNFILTEREYDTREEAAEAAQTVCCVLMNHCGWNVFYRIVKPADSNSSFHELITDGSIVSDDELCEDEKEEDEDEAEDEDEENCSFDKFIEENADEFLAWMRDYLNKNDSND